MYTPVRGEPQSLKPTLKTSKSVILQDSMRMRMRPCVENEQFPEYFRLDAQIARGSSYPHFQLCTVPISPLHLLCLQEHAAMPRISAVQSVDVAVSSQKALLSFMLAVE
jgi:hypothetical protein